MYLKHILYLVNSSKVVIMDTSADQIVVLLIMQFSPLNLFLITGEEADNKMQNDALKNSILVNSRVNEDLLFMNIMHALTLWYTLFYLP